MKRHLWFRCDLLDEVNTSKNHTYQDGMDSGIEVCMNSIEKEKMVIYTRSKVMS